MRSKLLLTELKQFDKLYRIHMIKTKQTWFYYFYFKSPSSGTGLSGIN